MNIISSFYKFKKLILQYIFNCNALSLKLKSYDSSILMFSEHLVKLFISRIHNFITIFLNRLVLKFKLLVCKFEDINNIKNVIYKLNLVLFKYLILNKFDINLIFLNNFNKIILNFIKICNIYLISFTLNHNISNYASLNTISFSKLPVRITKYTLLRSPHADKKSREQFEYRKFQSVLNLKSFIFYKFLPFVQLPSGVGFQYKKTYYNI